MTRTDLPTTHVALLDLLERRRAQFEASAPRTAAIYVPRFEQKEAEIQAFFDRPEAPESRPLADQLAEAAARQEGRGRELHETLTLIGKDPDVPAEGRAAARRACRALFKQHPGVVMSYPSRAGLARRLRKRVEDHASDLAMLPAKGGITMQARVDAWLGDSATIGRLLSERSDLEARRRETAGAVLRNTTLGLIGRARATLADELAADPEAAARVDAAVFGHFDALVVHAHRGASSANDDAAVEPDGR